jgi:hypothetical protein
LQNVALATEIPIPAAKAAFSLASETIPADETAFPQA